MKITSLATTTVASLVLFASSASAWSAVGHEIVATIAQAHLTPSTLSAIAAILPPYAEGHLAPIAAWADSIRYAHRDTGVLHYVNAIGDDPADKCVFGDEGWVDGERNLLKAVGNYSKRVMDGEGDIPLRFLVHFLGDIHQPLHLSGKLRGGNQAIVKFEGRRASLHSAWDGLFINKAIRELGNYTTPLPNKRIESALRGKNYDPLVRFIIAEGINGFWSTAAQTEWPSCPSPSTYEASYPRPKPRKQRPSVPLGSMFAHDQTEAFAAIRSAGEEVEEVVEQPVRKLKEGAVNLQLNRPAMFPMLLSMLGVPTPVISLFPRTWLEVPKTWKNEFPDEQEREGKVPGCPWKWAEEMHGLNCAYVWPSNFTAGMELNTPGYWGKIKGDLVVEKQLAIGGIRLAAVLNSIFDPALVGKLGVVDTSSA